MSSTAFLSMWLSNTSTAAMVMPIVEAVAQQVISAEAEVEATQMTYFSGSTNQALEIDGTTFALATVGSSYLGNGINSRIVFWINYPYRHDMNSTLLYLYFPVFIQGNYITQIFYLQLMVEFTFSDKRGRKRMTFLYFNQSDKTLFYVFISRLRLLFYPEMTFLHNLWTFNSYILSGDSITFYLGYFWFW